MSDDANIEARLAALEEHAAHQARLIEDLDEAVRRQWDEVERLRKRLAQAMARLSELQGALGPHAAEKPPHY
ncbi:SlyX family protein [Oceanicella actignis]|uniref:SlyX protein n=1 Tax=Oceanicella actignis TaxID=1189325 RepID=A0A1M7T1C9_9RHOB|nr:SlyX family protein [Oceanicella actignis]SET37835.1 SlyX protein [Oceanicella actignis]SHN64580.1 SlyX protein [Oceanicella actignis]